MKTYERALIEAYQQSPNLLCLLSAISIFLIDILTGEHIHFPIFFAVPAGLAAWQLNRPLAYSLSVFLPLLRVGFFYISGDGPLNIISIINALIIIAALSAYVYLITRIIRERRELELKVSQLEERLYARSSGERRNGTVA
jgi:hypothetical protein